MKKILSILILTNLGCDIYTPNKQIKNTETSDLLNNINIEFSSGVFSFLTLI